MQEKNETRTRQVCEPKMEERCVNFTLPSFEKVLNCFVIPILVERAEQVFLSNQVDVDMTENVELGSLKADIRETERTKCLNIPRAKVPHREFSKP